MLINVLKTSAIRVCWRFGLNWFIPCIEVQTYDCLYVVNLICAAKMILYQSNHKSMIRTGYQNSPLIITENVLYFEHNLRALGFVEAVIDACYFLGMFPYRFSFNHSRKVFVISERISQKVNYCFLIIRTPSHLWFTYCKYWWNLNVKSLVNFNCR